MISKIKLLCSKKLNSLSVLEKIVLYFFFCSLIILSSLILAFLIINKFPHYIDANGDLIIKNIPFGNGPLINELIVNKNYKSSFYNIDFYLQKLPLLPIFYFFILSISKNFYFFIILKNLILVSFFYFIVFDIIKSNNKNILNFISVLGCLFIIPYNSFVILNYMYADSFLVIFLAIFFILLISKYKRRFELISFLLFLLYLTKTSMLFLVILTPFLILILEKDRRKYLTFIGPMIAIILWGSFGYIKTGRAAIGTSILTVNSMGMHLVTQQDFFNYYPKKSVDILQHKILVPKFNNEWQFHDYFKEKNKNYFKDNSNKLDYLKGVIKKIKFTLFNIHRDGAQPQNGKFDNSIRYSFIPNKIVFIFCIFYSIFNIFKNIKTISKMRSEIYYISSIILILIPYIAAWATSKHLIPIFIISFYYLLFKSYAYNQKI